MASLAQLLFTVGTFVLAIAFAAHVGHAVLLANGRRAVTALGSTAPRSPQPAWAGVATGSFVQARAEADAAAPRTFASPSALSGASTWLAIGAFALLASSMLLRAILVGRGPWGNLFEFSVAFSASIVGGYLVLSRRYPIKSIGWVPLGVGLGIALYASSLPSEIEPLVPALQNAPLLTIHVGMAMLSYGIFATSFGAGVGYLIQGKDDRFSWLPGPQGPRRGRLPGRDRRLPGLRDDDHPRLVVGLDRLVPLLGLGPEGDRGPRHVADLRDLPPRPEPAILGRPARRPVARDRVRDGPRHVFGVALVQRPARLLGALARSVGAGTGPLPGRLAAQAGSARADAAPVP